jgi:PDZ domain/PEGA domain
MRGTARRYLLLVIAVCSMAASGGAVLRGAQAPAGWDADLAEGQRLFDELDYEHAVPLLSRAIIALEPMVRQQPQARTALVSAYGMRARALFGLDDPVKAQDDFRALLTIDPSYALSGQISPRVVALFEKVRAAVVGSLVLAVNPPDAQLELNGLPTAAASGPVPLAAGEYTVKATRLGYKPAEETVSVVAGETKQFSLTLDRTSSVVFVVTVPPDVEVVVDGLSRGRTVAGPLPPAYAGAPAELGVRPELVSQPLVLSDLTQGTHTVQYKKECYVTEERKLPIEKPDDYQQDPAHLQPAVASIAFESTPAGAAVFVDGARRGTTPATLSDVCEGPRTVELRGAEGRLVQRIAVKTGESMRVQGALKPAFALLTAGSGLQAGVSDRRADVERALAGSRQVTVFVPGGREADEALKGQQMPPEWLAFDAGRRPLGGAAALNAAARRDLSTRFARALDVQGIAAISQPSPSSPDLVVALIAAGAGEPDVVAVTPERTDSINRAIARFDYLPSLARRGIGLLAADVLDVEGLVVVRVDPGSAGDQAGIKPGDVLARADGGAITGSAQLQQLLDSKPPGAAVSVEAHDASGTVRTVQVPVAESPRLMSVSDQGLLFNPISLALRSRLAAAAAGDQPFVRLNLAVALMRLGDFAAAREQLEAVQLPPGPGISQGTQQYLLGLTYEGSGDAASAQRSFQDAAASGGLLTEDGPPVKGLAERKLVGLGVGVGRSSSAQ